MYAPISRSNESVAVQQTVQQTCLLGTASYESTNTPWLVYLPWLSYAAVDPEQVGPALHRLSFNLPKPKAIVVMSAHWESQSLEVSTSTRPQTWHDFRGFPAELYRIHYPAPGAPELAEDILKRLADAHLTAHANSTRPRDHGVWMPLLHMYPEADIPVIEISLPMQLNSDEIYAVGQALAPLREQQILLIGSGSITHNLAELRGKAICKIFQNGHLAFETMW